jgi:ketopantoate reductase
MGIAVLGAGGIGGYVSGRLAEAGRDVTLVARGRHLAAMRERGLKIESPLWDARLDEVKPTELEWLSGRIHHLGREPGVPTPAHSVIWAALAPYKDGPARSLA